jgi:hypothetical protein
MLTEKFRQKGQHTGEFSGGDAAGSQFPQSVGEDRLLRRRELRKAETSAGEETPVPAGAWLAPDDGTPHHLGGEDQRPESWRKLEVAGDTGSEEIQMLNARTFEAQVQEANLLNFASAHGRVTRNTYPRG